MSAPRLTFDEASHIYKWDGVVKPSVTQIIAGVGLKANYVKDSPNKVLGTACHRAIEYWEKGQFTETGTHPAILRRLAHYRKFKEGIGNPPLLASEQRMYSVHFDFTGTVDLIYELQNGLLIVDLKFTEHTPPTKPTALQTAGYAILAQPEDPKSVRRFSLAISEDGYKPREYSDREDIPNFLACNRVFRLEPNIRRD